MNPISRRVRVSYAAPAAALAAVALLLNAYLPKFYTDAIGVRVGVVAVIMVVGRAFDAVTDPLIGVLSDRTPGRLGRRRPWIFLASLPLAVTFLLLLWPELRGGIGPTAWMIAGMLSVMLFWTALSIPYEALGAELSEDYDERTSLFGLREVFLLGGTVAAAASPVLLRTMLGLGQLPHDQEILFRALGWIWAALVLVLSILCAWLVPERNSPPAQQELSPVAVVRDTLSNRSFRILLGAYVVAAFGNHLPATMVLYYTQYVLQTPHGDLLLLLYLSMAIAAMPAWIHLAHRFGKKEAWLTSMALTVLVFVWAIPLGPGDLPVFVVITLLTGAAGGGVLSLPHAMQPDVIDEDELRTGERREGQFLGMWSVAKKSTAALGVGVGLALLELAGYEPNATQPPAVTTALRTAYIVIPCLSWAGATLLGLRYPLDRARHEEIRREIRRRRALEIETRP